VSCPAERLEGRLGSHAPRPNCGENARNYGMFPGGIGCGAGVFLLSRKVPKTALRVSFLDLLLSMLRRFHAAASVVTLGEGESTMLARALAIAIALSILGAAAGAQKERSVNFYNWSDYIDPAVLEDFTRETGIKVKYDTFDSNDVLETKLLAGRTGYDLVVPTAYFLARQIKAGIFQKLDKSKLPNLKNAWGDIAERLAVYDPGNQFAVNYMWGTTGIGYNVKKAREVLGDGKIDSLDVVFKPEVIAKFKDCGVHILDASDDVFAAAFTYLKIDPNTKDPTDFEKAADLLTKVRPFVRKFHSSEYLNALASGEICLVFGYSGDVKQAQKRAAEAKNGVEIAYAIPKEGTQLWFDNLSIPKDAKNVAEAHALIDYLLRPEVAAKNSNVISYANGNAASRPLIDKAIIDDKTVYPDDATVKTFYIIQSHDQKTQRLMNRLWTKVKTGR
jgi:putrescine transport system substrate-binding protein